VHDDDGDASVNLAQQCLAHGLAEDVRLGPSSQLFSCVCARLMVAREAGIVTAGAEESASSPAGVFVASS
jgi:hypothetical protein